MTQHKCIKCQSSYEDQEEDAYYCPPCVEEKNQIASELNTKYRTVGQVPNGAAQFFNNYDQIKQSKGSAYVNARDLGLI